MKHDPVIHIGFHKTGTSWFQQAVYPLVTSHHLVDRDLVRSTFMGGDAFAFDPAEARLRIDQVCGGRPCLICEEDLSGILHIGAVSTYVARSVAERLHETFPNAQVIIFVRAQYEAAASWYVQYVREGGTASPRRYFFPDQYLFPGRNMPFKLSRFDFSQLDYSGLVQEYDRLFGSDRVHVFAYEELALDPASILGRLKSIGLQFPEGRVVTSRVNAALRRGLIPLARATGLFTARSVVNKRTLVHLPFWFRGRLTLLNFLDSIPLFGPRANARNILDRQTRAWIAARFGSSNQWLEERIGIDLGALGYPVEPQRETADEPSRSPLLSWTRK